MVRAFLWLVSVVDRAPYLRELHWRPALRRWYFPLRTAALVSPSARFLAFELLRRRGVRRYRLRGTGLSTAVRHPLNDMWILDEIFVQRVYEPPPEVLSVLGPAPRVLDLGGHAGNFALFALSRFPGAEVTSFEPNPQNAAMLDWSREANGVQARWRLERAAAGAAPGTLQVSGESFLSRVGGDAGVEVEVRDVLPLLDTADLAKIDIEGGEWPLLEDPRLATAAVRALVLELHELAPGDTTYRDRAVQLLRDAGFTTGPLFDERPDTACIWAWKETR
jgi:FkbM family methyltransferase